MDIIFKLARRGLSPNLYRAVSNSLFGRSRQWAGIQMPKSIAEYYFRQGLDPRGKIILEVGAGNQVYTALFFLNWGAAKVIVVDPMIKVEKEKWRDSLLRFNQSMGTNLDFDSISNCIECFTDLSEVPMEYDCRVDAIYSHFALEHFHDLESFFFHNRRLLSNSGVSHNRIDLSDHTYHVFSKYFFLRKLSAQRSLFHLRYSKRFFEFLNDPKCYMNRKLFPEYLRLADRFGLVAKCVERRLAGKIKVHRNLMDEYPNQKAEDFQVIDFSMNFHHH